MENSKMHFNLAIKSESSNSEFGLDLEDSKPVSKETTPKQKAEDEEYLEWIKILSTNTEVTSKYLPF